MNYVKSDYSASNYSCSTSSDLLLFPRNTHSSLLMHPADKHYANACSEIQAYLNLYYSANTTLDSLKKWWLSFYLQQSQMDLLTVEWVLNLEHQRYFLTNKMT